VGSHILLPTAAEAGRITDAEARRRFNSDNASWKGLSPKYLANKQSHVAQPVASKPAPAKPAVVARIHRPRRRRSRRHPRRRLQPRGEGDRQGGRLHPVVVSGAASSAASTAPAPLPATAVGKPSTEMALALEDANAQLGQVTEMNHRLKLRLQALTEEVETLKAQLQDQTALQKEVAELKANPTPPWWRRCPNRAG
jgi:pilus assembly protein FimV